MPDIAIRITELSQCPEHIPILADWFWGEWGHQRQGNSPEKIAARLHTFLNGGKIPLTLVALWEGVPVGTASVRPNDMAIRPHLQPWLASVYVDQHRRRAGIGSRLVNEAEERVRHQGFRELYLYTADRQDFYTSLGWSVEENTSYHEHDISIMRKCLAQPYANSPALSFEGCTAGNSERGTE